jgi:hypothetical protein
VETTAFDFENRPAQSNLVEAIWRTRSEHAGSFVSAAAARWEMVVIQHAGRTTLAVRGPETRATLAEFPAEAEFFGITFKLGTFMPHLPVSTIMDRRDPALPDASAKSFWLNGSTWQYPTFDNADAFVARLAREGVVGNEPAVQAALQGQTPGLSPRALQYRFLRVTGLSQRLIHQIERARRAAALLGQGHSILDTAFEAGYFDQAHLTRALKRFLGHTPAQIAQIGQEK